MTTLHGMNADQLRAAAPSIFARHADGKKVSGKYGFIPTGDMVKAFREAGYVPMQAAGQRSYKGGSNHLYGRHMIRMMPAGPQAKAQVGEVVPNVTIYNSHNGRTMYKCIAGLFRLVCSNGLMVAYRDFGSIVVRHNADALINVLAASERIIAQAREATVVVGQMRGIKLSKEDQHKFAASALRLRYSASAPIKADALLVAKRPEDDGADLWHVFNRVQENIMRGGQEGQAATGRRLTLRPITNIRRDIGINLDLWGMTMQWMQRHGHTPKLPS